MPARCDYPHERESEPLRGYGDFIGAALAASTAVVITCTARSRTGLFWRRSREAEPEGLWQGGRELRMPLGQRLRTCRQKGAGASLLPRKLLRAVVARLLERKA
jgi:hypothetical protein